MLGFPTATEGRVVGSSTRMRSVSEAIVNPYVTSAFSIVLGLCLLASGVGPLTALTAVASLIAGWSSAWSP